MMYREKLMPGACESPLDNLTRCGCVSRLDRGRKRPCLRNSLTRKFALPVVGGNAALSRHFQEVLGTDRQPEECAVIIGNWFQRGRFSWFERLPVTQDAAGSSPVAPAIHSK